jgi:hypothetical protein
LAVAWLYKQYIKVEELGKQQSAIAKYLDTVDEVLFAGRKSDLRGWASEQERVSSSSKPDVPSPSTSPYPSSARVSRTSDP